MIKKLHRNRSVWTSGKPGKKPISPILKRCSNSTTPKKRSLIRSLRALAAPPAPRNKQRAPAATAGRTEYEQSGTSLFSDQGRHHGSRAAFAHGGELEPQIQAVVAQKSSLRTLDDLCQYVADCKKSSEAYEKMIVDCLSLNKIDLTLQMLRTYLRYYDAELTLLFAAQIYLRAGKPEACLAYMQRLLVNEESPLRATTYAWDFCAVLFVMGRNAGFAPCQISPSFTSICPRSIT